MIPTITDPAAKCPLFQYYSLVTYEINCLYREVFETHGRAKMYMNRYCNRIANYMNCPIYSKNFMQIEAAKITVRPCQDGRTDYIDAICGLRKSARMIPSIRCVSRS